MLEESILQGLVSGVAPCTLKEQLVLLAQENGRKQEHEGIARCVGIGANTPTPCPVARTLTG